MDKDVDKVDEFGAYGGVYRNRKMGDALLIGDGTLENVGVIHNTISLISEEGIDWYVLKTAEDFEWLLFTIKQAKL